jgi:DNA methylase
VITSAIAKYQRKSRERTTLGFVPTCECDSVTGPGLVYDPFMGSGTTALVARRLGRDYIGCDLNPDYVAMANTRLSNSDPMQDRIIAPGFVQKSIFGEV